MERHHTATAGSAAVDEEMVLRVDPVNAVEVDKISDSRVAGSRGSQPEESCDKKAHDAAKKNKNKNKNKNNMSPLQHAALQGCTPQAIQEEQEKQPTNERFSRESPWHMGEHFARPWHLLGDRIHQMALPTVVEDGDSNPSGTQEFTARLET